MPDAVFERRPHQALAVMKEIENDVGDGDDPTTTIDSPPALETLKRRAPRFVQGDDFTVQHNIGWEVEGDEFRVSTRQVVAGTALQLDPSIRCIHEASNPIPLQLKRPCRIQESSVHGDASIG